MSSTIWINNFQEIFSKPIDFFPTRGQSNEERLNAIVRLSLYISVLLSVYHSDIKYTAIFIFVLFLTYIIYSNHPETTTPTEPNTTVEQLDGAVNKNPATCTKPTIENPFMNFTMKDYMTFDSKGNTVDRPQACDPSDPTIKRLSDSGFDNDLYKDVSDIFGKMNSQRNFYTMPSTSIVNDQEAFANWLYKTPQTCKENQDNCINGNFEDLRSNRFVFATPTENPTDSKRLQK
jgi:hypothetical protein